MGPAGFDLQGGDHVAIDLCRRENNPYRPIRRSKARTLIVDSISSIGTGNLNMNQTTTHNPTLVLNEADPIGRQSEPARIAAVRRSSRRTIQLSGTALTINETDTTSGSIITGLARTTVLSLLAAPR